MKRDKLDAVFSDLTRERANWQCEVCGAGRDAHLECSHIFGRAKISVRWHPDNSLCLCHHHHRQFTQHPLMHAEFVRDRFGVPFHDNLIRLANTPRHFSPAEKEAIYQAYKISLATMREIHLTLPDERVGFRFPDLSNVQPLARKPGKRAKAKANGPKKKIANRGFDKTKTVKLRTREVVERKSKRAA